MVGTSLKENFVQQIYKKANGYDKKAVFIDRDGTIIKEVNYLSDSSQIQLLPGVPEAIQRLNGLGIPVIIVTNQPVVARGLATIKEVTHINDTLVTLLQRHNAFVNAVYFCPHHPETNHSDIPSYAIQYRVKCECRKPKVAMLKKAIDDFNINVVTSYIIGDRTVDIKTGVNLGIKTILMETGYAGGDKKYSVIPDYITHDFNNAVDLIINHKDA